MLHAACDEHHVITYLRHYIGTKLWGGSVESVGLAVAFTLAAAARPSMDVTIFMPTSTAAFERRDKGSHQRVVPQKGDTRNILRPH
jgi:hypothetical protein